MGFVMFVKIPGLVIIVSAIVTWVMVRVTAALILNVPIGFPKRQPMIFVSATVAMGTVIILLIRDVRTGFQRLQQIVLLIVVGRIIAAMANVKRTAVKLLQLVIRIARTAAMESVIKTGGNIYRAVVRTAKALTPFLPVAMGCVVVNREKLYFRVAKIVVIVATMSVAQQDLQVIQPKMQTAVVKTVRFVVMEFVLHRKVSLVVVKIAAAAVMVGVVQKQEKLQTTVAKIVV